MAMSKCIRVSVEWGYDEHAIILPAHLWDRIINGDPVVVFGGGFPYEAEYFFDDWRFRGGVEGELLVTYSGPNGDGSDTGDGFVGKLGDATIEEFDDPLWGAYMGTTFEVNIGEAGDSLQLQVGQLNPQLDTLLKSMGAETWIMITAWNPGSEVRTPKENAMQNGRLRETLEELGLSILTGQGQGSDPNWEPEASFFVPGASLMQGFELGVQFGQRAILAGSRGGPPRLMECGSPGP
jgi:hypothetical protein